MHVSAGRALAYRVAAHSLDSRLQHRRLDAALPAGMRERPPDGAGPALHARVDGMTLDRYEQSLAEGRLTALYAMRGAVYVVSESDAAMFSAAVIPGGEAAVRD